MGLAVALDTFKVGIISNVGEWQVKPNYCAVEAYNDDQKIASVRACPISAFTPSEYWNLSRPYAKLHYNLTRHCHPYNN